MFTFEASLTSADVIEFLKSHMHIDPIVVAILESNPPAMVSFLAGKLDEAIADFRKFESANRDANIALGDAKRKLKAAEKNGLKMQAEIAKLRTMYEGALALKDDKNGIIVQLRQDLEDAQLKLRIAEEDRLFERGVANKAVERLGAQVREEREARKDFYELSKRWWRGMARRLGCKAVIFTAFMSDPTFCGFVQEWMKMNDPEHNEDGNEFGLLFYINKIVIENFKGEMRLSYLEAGNIILDLHRMMWYERNTSDGWISPWMAERDQKGPDGDYYFPKWLKK